MSDEQFDAQEVIETPASEGEAVETPEEPKEGQDDEVTTLRREKEELEAKNKKLYARLQAKKEEKEPERDNKTLSTKDTIALINAKVSEDDFDEVVNYASYRKISVTEALKDSVLKTILADNIEKRTTAMATQTRGGARGTNKVSPEVLLSRASKGQMPDSDEEMDRLISARHGKRA